MSTSLITKLRATVNDPTLPILGAGRIQFKITSASMKGLYLYLSQDAKITTDNAVSILDNGGTEVYPEGTSFNLSADTHYFVKPSSLNQVVVVTVHNKYGIKILGTVGGYQANDVVLMEDCNYLTSLLQVWTNSGGTLNLDLFKESTLLNMIYTVGLASCTGKLSSLKGNVNTLNIVATNSDVTGDVAELTLANNTSIVNLPPSSGIVGNISRFYGFNLSDLGIAKTRVGGNLEGFLEQWYSQTKTSINLGLNDSILFHGASLTNAWGGKAEKSNGILTLKTSSNVVLGTYDGSTWTYA